MPAESPESPSRLPPPSEAAAGEEASGLADGELLRRYADHWDTGSFELLVRRHQKMVMGVAYRILSNADAAEDVVQETFFQLARLARTLKTPDSLPAWLHKVAANAALRTLLSNKRRSVRESQAITPPEIGGPGPETKRRLVSMVDRHLAALPEKYRVPIILCYLEGLTHKQASDKMGVPEGSMSTLLNRGLELLRERVKAAGGTLTGALLLSVLCAEARALSPALLSQVVRQASAPGLAAGLGWAGIQGVTLSVAGQVKAAALSAALIAGVLGYGGGATGDEIAAPEPQVLSLPALPMAQPRPIQVTGLPRPQTAAVVVPSPPPPAMELPGTMPERGRSSEAPGREVRKGPPAALFVLPDLPGSASDRALEALGSAPGRSAARRGNSAGEAGGAETAAKEAGKSSDRGGNPSGMSKDGNRPSEAMKAANAAAQAALGKAMQSNGQGLGKGKGKSGK
jgi:RNA polymerase sigma factor (sigma-70 family)